MSEISRAAQEGARFMDYRVPGWHGMVEPAGLDMQNGCGCILGQVFKDKFMDAGQPTGFAYGSDYFALTQAEACRLGFIIPAKYLEEYLHARDCMDAQAAERASKAAELAWSELSRAWQIEILARRGVHARLAHMEPVNA